MPKIPKRQINRPDEPGCYVVYSKGWDENFCGDLVEARQWLNGIVASHADAVGE